MAIKSSHRLPTGLFAYRGKARRFTDLPDSVKHQWRSHWSQKGWEKRYREEKEAIREVVVVEHDVTDPRYGKRNQTSFRADVLEDGPSIKQVTQAIAAHLEKKGIENAAWVVKIEWPKDPRSEKGKPYTTFASIRKYTVGSGRNKIEKFAIGIEEGPEQLDRNHSGAKGPATIVEIAALAKKREVRITEIAAVVTKGKGRKRK